LRRPRPCDVGPARGRDDEGNPVRTLVSPRHQILALGLTTGVAGATLTLVLAAWLGIGRGASLGLLLAAAAGAAGPVATARVLERAVCDHFTAADPQGWGLPAAEPPPIGGTLGETLGLVREALRREKLARAEVDEIGRRARAFWPAVHSQAGATAPADTKA